MLSRKFRSIKKRRFYGAIIGLFLSFIATFFFNFFPQQQNAYSAVESKKATAENVPNESIDNNAVEVDGLRFEVLVPERIWKIPPQQPDVYTEIKLGIRITNNNPYPIRLSWAETIYPQLVSANGEVLKAGVLAGSAVKVWDYDCPLILPGEGQDFFPHTRLQWIGNNLTFLLSEGKSARIIERQLGTGIYQLQLIYDSQQSELLVWSSTSSTERPRIVSGVWLGKVLTPLVEIQIVQD